MTAQALALEALHACLGPRLAQRLGQRLALRCGVTPLDVQDQESRGIGRGRLEGGRERPLADRIGAEGLLVGIAQQARVLAHLCGHVVSRPVERHHARDVGK